MTTITAPPPPEPTPPASTPSRTAAPPLRLGPIARVLCWTGAIDPTNRTRHELNRALAGPVLLFFTAGLAFVSGSIFAHDLLHLSTELSMVAGLGFATFVFFLDRLIILSLDGLHGARRLATGLIRLAMALLLGYVVAEPFVLRIFANEVQAEMVSYAQAREQAEAKAIGANDEYGDDALKEADDLVALLTARAATTAADPAAVAADPEVARLTEAAAAAEEARRAQEAKVECENDGTCGTGRVGAGPEWDRKQAELRRLEGEVERLRSELEAARRAAEARSVAVQTAGAGAAKKDLRAAEADRTLARKHRQAAEERSRKAIRAEDGLGAQMDALHRLREKRPSIRTEWLLVTALLMVLDTSAVALKLMQRPSMDDETRELDRRAEVARREAITRHEAEQLQTSLEEDAALRGLLRAAVRQHHEEEIRTFLEQVPTNAETPDSVGNAQLPDQAASELQQRLADRWWRPNPLPGPS